MAMPPQSRRAVAAAVLLCLPALASARLTAAGNNVYAGVYSNACNDRSKPMVRFYDDVMTVEQGGKTVTAKPFKVSKNHLGATPPPDFRAAYVGDVKGGDGLVLVIYHNADVKEAQGGRRRVPGGERVQAT